MKAIYCFFFFAAFFFAAMKIRLLIFYETLLVASIFKSFIFHMITQTHARMMKKLFSTKKHC